MHAAMGASAALVASAAFLTAMVVSGQTQGLDLKLDHDMVSPGDRDPFGQLTCQATGNSVSLRSVTVIWVKVTGEATDLLTVTPNSRRDSVSRDGIIGNGTLEFNHGYIFLNQMEAASCDSSYFLCEVMFTKQSGEMGRAVATSFPSGHRSGHAGQEALEKRLADMSAAFEMFNTSYANLLENRKHEQVAQAKILSRLRKLEDDMSAALNTSGTCEPCSNTTWAVVDLERRLEHLEKQNMTSGTAPQDGESTQGPKHTFCERGMSETFSEDFVIFTHPAIGKQFRCDAQTDGGGWIVFQRRAAGDVDFYKTWSEYRQGFGDLTGDFWLGNEAIYNLTNEADYELRVDFNTLKNVHYAQYSTFKILDEDNNYRLELGEYTAGTTNETPTSGLGNHNNTDFSTRDRDNDKSGPLTCTSYGFGGWWYVNCWTVNLNGRFPGTQTGSPMRWESEDEKINPIASEMKIRLL